MGDRLRTWLPLVLSGLALIAAAERCSGDLVSRSDWGKSLEGRVSELEAAKRDAEWHWTLHREGTPPEGHGQ